MSSGNYERRPRTEAASSTAAKQSLNILAAKRGLHVALSGLSRWSERVIFGAPRRNETRAEDAMAEITRLLSKMVEAEWTNRESNPSRPVEGGTR